jgi:hypothetical protein
LQTWGRCRSQRDYCAITKDKENGYASLQIFVRATILDAMKIITPSITNTDSAGLLSRMIPNILNALFAAALSTDSQQNQ